MKHGYSNCKWCGDRLGGCLYCIDDLEEPVEKLESLQDMIARGEIHVVAIRQEVLVRPVVANHSLVKKPVPAAPGPARVCVDHDWVYEVPRMRRRCRRPGCTVVQVFRWLPSDPDRNGEWVACATATLTEAAAPRPSKARKRK